MRDTWALAFRIYAQHERGMNLKQAAVDCARLYNIGTPLARNLAFAVWDSVNSSQNTVENGTHGGG